MKTCFKCNQDKPKRQFYKHPGMADGHLNKCIDCAKQDTRLRYRNPKKRQSIRAKLLAYDKTAKGRAIRRVIAGRYRAKYPEKIIARSRARYLEKQPCEYCLTTDKVEAHHPNYSKPLQVVWLCKNHHEVIHNKIMETTK